jgi:hypothetical protein
MSASSSQVKAATMQLQRSETMVSLRKIGACAALSGLQRIRKTSAKWGLVLNCGKCSAVFREAQGDPSGVMTSVSIVRFDGAEGGNLAVRPGEAKEAKASQLLWGMSDSSGRRVGAAGREDLLPASKQARSSKTP